MKMKKMPKKVRKDYDDGGLVGVEDGNSITDLLSRLTPEQAAHYQTLDDNAKQGYLTELFGTISPLVPKTVTSIATPAVDQTLKNSGIEVAKTGLDVSKVGNIFSGANDLYNMTNTGNPEQDSGNAAFSGAIKGAEAGAAFGLPGAAVGTALGLAAGVVGNQNAKKKANRAMNAMNVSYKQAQLANNIDEIPGYSPGNSPNYKQYKADGGPVIENRNIKTGKGIRNLMAKGGKVVGPGTAKSDSIDTNLEPGSFVVPTENQAKAMALRKHLGLGIPTDQLVNAQKNFAGGGTVPVSLSNGEHVFTPQEVAKIKYSGYGQYLEALAPDAENATGLKEGGVVGYVTVKEPEKKPLPNVFTPTPKTDTLAGQGVRNILDPNAEHPFAGKGIRNKQQLKDGGIVLDRKALLDSLNDPNVQAYLAGIRSAESDGTDNVLSAKNPDSSASGAFQFVKKTRQSILDKYGVDAYKPDITEQALAAVALIDSRGQLDNIKAGKFDDADKVLSSEWSSLPGGSQPNKATAKIADVRTNYDPKTSDYKIEAPKMGFNQKFYDKLGEAVKSSRVKSPEPTTAGPYTVTATDQKPSRVSTPQILSDPGYLKDPFYTKKPAPQEPAPVAPAIDPDLRTPNPDDVVTPAVTRTPSDIFSSATKDMTSSSTPDILPMREANQAIPTGGKQMSSTDPHSSIFDSLGGWAGLAALGQTAYGIYENGKGEYPFYKPDPDLVAMKNAAINDYKTGMDPATEAAANTGLELNRRAQIEDIVRLAGGDSGLAINNIRKAGLDKDRAITQLAAEKEQMRSQKLGTALNASATVAAADPTHGELVDLFGKNQAASGHLINAGLSNLFGSIQHKDFVNSLNKQQASGNEINADDIVKLASMYSKNGYNPTPSANS